jgi:hypothetical protein
MVSMMLANGLIMLVSIASIPVYIVGLSIPSIATRRLEMGEETLSFRGLVRDSLAYFWRVLGIFLLIWVGMVAFMFVFMACIGALSVFTLGLGMICAIPLFFLFIPVAILVYSLMELGMSAVLVDDLSVSSALQRAWDLFKRNWGGLALLSIVIYLVSMAVGMIISFPMFGFFSNIQMEPDMQDFDKLFKNMTLWMLAFSPIYAVLQGILLTFMQSVWTLAYMRIVKPQDHTPLIATANA